MYLPKAVEVIIEKLNNAGFEAFAVGGCVRDSLLGKEPKDYDICTNALPEQVVKVFKDYNIIPTGLKHGTVTVMYHKIGYEITTYRIDGDYSDGRHPDNVVFTTQLANDLARRDFTINAMAYSPKIGIVDIFGGAEDLKKGIIRCVGNPYDRFSEDALRIMRAMRFASVLGFSIDQNTKNAMLSLKQNIGLVSAERINAELSKLLCGKGAVAILDEFVDILVEIIPEIKKMVGFEQHSIWHKYDVWKHTLCVINGVPQSDLCLRLSALLHDIGKPDTFTFDENGNGHFYGHCEVSLDKAKDILRRLKYSNEIIDEVCCLVYYHDIQIATSKKSVKKLLNMIGETYFCKLIELKKADISAQNYKVKERLEELAKIKSLCYTILNEKECFSLKQLAVDGYDLMALNIPQGKEVGKMLNLLLDKVVNEELPNEKSALLGYVKTVVKK